MHARSASFAKLRGHEGKQRWQDVMHPSDTRSIALRSNPPGQTAFPSIMEAAISGGWRWLALAGLYVVLAGSLEKAELVAAALTGLVAAALSLRLRRAGGRQFRLSAPWLRLALCTGRAVLSDTARVGGALARALFAPCQGTLQRQVFTEREHSAGGAERSALAILLGSLAPNGYVIEEQPGHLLLHRLVPAPPSLDVDWPI